MDVTKPIEVIWAAGPGFKLWPPELVACWFTWLLMQSCRPASEMTYIVSSGALNSTHSRRAAGRSNNAPMSFELLVSVTFLSGWFFCRYRQRTECFIRASSDRLFQSLASTTRSRHVGAKRSYEAHTRRCSCRNRVALGVASPADELCNTRCHRRPAVPRIPVEIQHRLEHQAANYHEAGRQRTYRHNYARAVFRPRCRLLPIVQWTLLGRWSQPHRISRSWARAGFIRRHEEFAVCDHPDVERHRQVAASLWTVHSAWGHLDAAAAARKSAPGRRRAARQEPAVCCEGKPWHSEQHRPVLRRRRHPRSVSERRRRESPAAVPALFAARRPNEVADNSFVYCDREREWRHPRFGQESHLCRKNAAISVGIGQSLLQQVRILGHWNRFWSVIIRFIVFFLVLNRDLCAILFQ